MVHKKEESEQLLNKLIYNRGISITLLQKAGSLRFFVSDENNMPSLDNCLLDVFDQNYHIHPDINQRVSKHTSYFFPQRLKERETRVQKAKKNLFHGFLHKSNVPFLENNEIVIHMTIEAQKIRSIGHFIINPV